MRRATPWRGSASSSSGRSISYLLAKPISRHTIVISKLVVAAACTLVFAVVPMVFAGLVLLPDEPALALGFAAGCMAGGLAYCALSRITYSWHRPIRSKKPFHGI